MSVEVMSQNVLEQELADIVGPDGVICGPQALDVYADGAGRSTDLVRVLPRSDEEVISLVETAANHELKVFTVRGKFIPEGLAVQQGLLIDPARLNEISQINNRNMLAYIGAGVTFEQLEQELAAEGLGLLMPASAESPYVLRSYLERDALVGSVSFRQPQVSIFHAILADGRKWISGTQQTSPEGNADFREDQGPQISPIFGGSEDIYGIPVSGVVYVYPRKSERRVLAYGFDKLEDAVAFTYRLSRNEHCFEIAGGDCLWWSTIAADSLDLPPWTVLLSIEQHKALVDNQAGQVAAAAKGKNGSALAPNLTETLAGTLRRPWNVWERNGVKGAVDTVKYYTFSSKVPSLFAAASAELEELSVGRGFVPVYFGASFFCENTLHYAPEEHQQVQDRRLAAYARVLEHRALVSRARGPLAKIIFDRGNPATVNLMKQFKQLFDPEGLINPGQLMEGI